MTKASCLCPQAWQKWKEFYFTEQIKNVHFYFDYILLIICVTLNKLFNHHLASSAMELEIWKYLFHC